MDDLAFWDPRCERPTSLVSPVRVGTPSGPTKRQAAGPGWRQTSSGMYLPADVDGSVVEQRILEQSARIRSFGAVTGWAALRWHGARYFDGRDPDGLPRPVPLVGDKLRPDPRVHLTQDRIAPSEIVEIGGIPVATVQRALFDEVRWLEPRRRDAVVAIEMAAAAGLISARIFGDHLALRNTWTGVPFCREVQPLAGDDCRSPQEVRLKLVWIIDAGLPQPLCNQPIYDRDGQLIGIPDLFDPEAGLVGEYDGAAHRDPARRRRDLIRENVMRDVGLEYFTVVEGELANRRLVADRVLRARDRAKFLPPSERAWTIDAPPWRAPVESLHDRLVRRGTADLLRAV